MAYLRYITVSFLNLMTNVNVMEIHQVIADFKLFSRLFGLKIKKNYVSNCLLSIENRIYREELKESLGMNFFSPFQPEREFKVYKSCKCSQIICSRVH